MKLEQYIRNKTAQHLRPLLIKSECEVCDTSKTLELHHIKPFAELLSECLESLQLQKFDNVEEYSNVELNNITNYMLGVQLQTQHLTVCSECHKDIHEKLGNLCDIGDNFKLHYEKKRKIDEMAEKHRFENEVIPYLDSIVGKRLYKEEQKRVD